MSRIYLSIAVVCMRSDNCSATACYLELGPAMYRPSCSQCGLHSIVQLAYDDSTQSMKHADDICRVHVLALVS